MNQRAAMRDSLTRRMAILVARIEERDLTVFTVVGEVNAEQQIEAIRCFYDQGPTKNALWDLRRLEGPRISSEELRVILDASRHRQEARRGGRTALIVKAHVDFGMGRMSEALAEVSGMPYEIRTFRDPDEANDWLG